MTQVERVLPWDELDEDDRSVGEQMKDLGVLSDNPDTVVATNALWFPKGTMRGPYKRNWDISITKTAMTFSEKAYKAAGPCFIPGIAKMADDTVLLLNPTKDVTKGYKISFNRTSYRVTAPKLMSQLLTKGIAIGKYKLVTASKGRFAAIPIKRSAN